MLFDPVIRANDQYLGYWRKTEFVRKRRNQWTSPQEMFERFQNRPPFDSWDRGVLLDYCDYGLEPAGNGYVLACPPAIEASIYENSSVPESNIYPEIAAITIPVDVVRAGRYRDPANVMGSSPTAPGLAASFARGVDTLLPGHSHFIPMESPELAAKLIADTLL